MSKYPDDDRRLQKLAAGQGQEWKSLYDEMRSPFRLFFIKYGAMPPEAALELYQEAMVVLYRNVVNGKLQPPLASTLKTYLFGIGKILLKKKDNTTGDWGDDIPELPVAPEVESQQEQKAKAELVRRLLDKVGEACRQVLELAFLKGYVMEAIAEELGLPSAGAARKRKHDCLKKLRELL
ncbi:MAG: sigma-70 family RNA polymerase sigma factor [Phaeodactylibacter sp.]|nr:sigma-70 family RNA polymerase sigma factor [Phaeodactylibacter sp.]MCB9266135.1 sigma-70 family RNA polymerase sigma factor [Lewinellaceae bacterium]